MVSKNKAISVLLAIDDNSTLMVMSYHLERYGFIVNSAQSNEAILETVDRIEPNIVIIDESLKGNIQCRDVCIVLKSRNKTKNTNIILLSANEEIEENLVDAVIKKPFVPSALVNKIRSVANQDIVATKKILSYHDIEMNVEGFKVTRLNKTIQLGPTEFKILQCLMELPGRVLSREHIMNYVWGPSAQIEQRTIDVHINRLRNALKGDGDEVPLIRTIRASGYSLNAPRELVRA